MSCIGLASSFCVQPAFKVHVSEEKKESPRVKGMRSHWEIGDHCSTPLFHSPYPELRFESQSGSFNYLLHCYNGIPDQELVGTVRQAYYRVLSRLNQSELQVKNFILPVQLMKLKYVDPYTRQRIVESLCQYLSLQMELRNVVFEQAGISFSDLCRLLVAIANNKCVKQLYLWHVLDQCYVPFKGPLQSDTNLDDLPRIPYTYNPGGRKYLRDLKKSKLEASSIERDESETSCRRSRFWSRKSFRDSEVFSQISWIEKIINEELHPCSNTNLSASGNYNDLVKLLADPSVDLKSHAFSQQEVGVQCGRTIATQPSINTTKSVNTVKSISNKSILSNLFIKTKLKCCKKYLKTNENKEISIDTLREIYIIALSALTNLTTLSVNYGLLADGTGEALLSIGSVVKGKLVDLELLCTMDDLPSPAHQQYDKNAIHAIPDLIWDEVKINCPDLRVHIVCVSMLTYDVTKLFITKSIPLNSLHLESGFCPTLIKRQLMFFSTLKVLSLNFKKTFEHIVITLWHSSGRIDSSLVDLIKKMPHLRTFEYNGPLQYKATINKLCDAALLPFSEIVQFKLLVQGDPCFFRVAQDLTAELYKKYLPRFLERSINFTLGTHNS